MRKIAYIVGIEGAGTAALAAVLHGRGFEVFGSDEGDGFYGDNLRKIGVRTFGKFSARNIPEEIDLAVYSTAFGPDNPEIAELRRRGVKLLSYPEAVAEIFNRAKTPIAVCGTHGKTTTTALTAEVLRACGARPTALVGAEVIGWRGNALCGGEDFFVLEADEYQNKLRYYNPKIVILTGVEYDHPDFFKTPQSYRQAFADFLARIPADGLLVACGDDEGAREVIDSAQISSRVIYYGFAPGNDAVVGDYNCAATDDLPAADFTLCDRSFFIRLPGRHNALNAAAAASVARWLDLPDECTVDGLRKFRGARRRLEFRGRFAGAILIDDYAHHPTEIRAALRTLREMYPNKKIIAAFHPHTFTRTEALLADFARSFDRADETAVIDVYSSARERRGEIGSRDLVEELEKSSSTRAIYLPQISDLVAWAAKRLGPEDVFVTLGAGDIWQAHDQLLKRQKQ